MKTNIIRFISVLLVIPGLFLAGCQSATPTGEVEAEPTQPVTECIMQEWRSIASSLPVANLMAWSHDGKYLAYIAPGETSSYNVGDLYLATGNDFGDTEKFYTNATGGILWSPDDSMIAFDAYRINQQVYTAYIQSLDKTTSVEIFPLEEGTTESSSRQRNTVAWLSNRELLATRACGSRCLEPVVYQLTSGELTPFDIPTRESVSRENLDGSGMVITSGGYYSILGVIPEGETTPLWIEANPEKDPVWESLYSFFPGWMVDSTHIYYLKQPYNIEMPYELWVRNQVTQEDTKLLSGIIQAVLSPQKDQVAFISYGRASYDDSNNFLDFVPDLRDTNRVGAGVYNLEDQALLAYQDLGETATEYFWQDPFLSQFTIAWSPDEKWIIYPDRYNNAYLLTISSGRSAQINLSDQNVIEVKWSPDGNTVAALLGNKRLVLLDAACMK